MPRRKPSINSGHSIRRSIAGLAARLIAEDGLDYGLAKRKAARSLGLSDTEILPTNEEIEEELRAYQAIYQADEQPERLRELREAALETMQFLEEFHPYLTGSVLDGTAGRYSEIELELFADSSKDVEIMLLSNSISYETTDIRSKNPNAPEARLRFDWKGNSILLAIFPLSAERHIKRNPHTGRSHLRARSPAVAELLESTTD